MSLEEQSEGEWEVSCYWRHPVLASRLLRATLLLSLYSLVTPTAADSIKLAQTIQQRLSLAGHLIEKMHGADESALSNELEELQARFLGQVDQTLANEANSFFQRVVTSYRKSVPKTKAVDSEAEEKRYLTKLEEVLAFMDSFEGLVAERGESVRAILDEATLSERIVRARSLAEKGAFSEAYSLVDGANHQLITALQALRDKETIEYRLEFASAADEYAYENRRFNSQKMLLDMVVAEKKPSENSMLLINDLIAVAEARMQDAKGLAETGQMEQAIDSQEQAVEALTKAMRFAGVYF